MTVLVRAVQLCPIITYGQFDTQLWHNHILTHLVNDAIDIRLPFWASNIIYVRMQTELD